MKPYRLYDILGSGMTVNAPDTCCLFCSKCTDVYWDYENGPYMFFCTDELPPGPAFEGKCEAFIEEDADG